MRIFFRDIIEIIPAVPIFNARHPGLSIVSRSWLLDAAVARRVSWRLRLEQKKIAGSFAKHQKSQKMSIFSV